MTFRNKLIDEHPLLVLPSLAVAIGLDQALMLQQLHYWMCRATVEWDGKKWVWNTLEQWHEQMPWWSLMTIRRILTALERQGLIVRDRLARHLGKDPRDQTAYYTVSYDALEALSISTAPDVRNEHVEAINLSKRRGSDRAHVYRTKTTTSKTICREGSSSNASAASHQRKMGGELRAGAAVWNSDDRQRIDRLIDLRGEPAVKIAADESRRRGQKALPTQVEAILAESSELSSRNTSAEKASARIALTEARGRINADLALGLIGQSEAKHRLAALAQVAGEKGK